MTSTTSTDHIAEQRKELAAGLDLALKQKAEIEKNIQHLTGGLATLDLLAAKIKSAAPAPSPAPSEPLNP